MSTDDCCVLVPAAATLWNQDVREIVAEYACGTVTDACSLRQVSKEWRRAADTTVRRSVRFPTSGSPDRPTLNVEVDNEALHRLRVAFTADKSRRVARLAIVAFALDGAKDEAHEGDVCGPRPVRLADDQWDSVVGPSDGRMVHPLVVAIVANCERLPPKALPETLAAELPLHALRDLSAVLTVTSEAQWLNVARRTGPKLANLQLHVPDEGLLQLENFVLEDAPLHEPAARGGGARQLSPGRGHR